MLGPILSFQFLIKAFTDFIDEDIEAKKELQKTREDLVREKKYLAAMRLIESEDGVKRKESHRIMKELRKRLHS